MSRNPGNVVSRYNFSSIFSVAWLKSMSLQHVISSFKAVGMHPLDSTEALYQLKLSSEEDPTKPEASLPFVPFLIPSRRAKAQWRPPTDTTVTKYAASHSHQDKDSPVSEPLDTERPSTIFSAAEEKLFQRRLEEGHDIPDAKYNE